MSNLMSLLIADLLYMNITTLKQTCTGVVAVADDSNFSELLHGNLWNRLIPERAPRIVVRAADEQDVIAAVRFARDHRLKVAVRGGRHNWSQPSLRHGGLLIDLMNLNKVISIDVEARRAVVERRRELWSLRPSLPSLPSVKNLLSSGSLIASGANQG
jgi:FAD binding domain